MVMHGHGSSESKGRSLFSECHRGNDRERKTKDEEKRVSS